MAETTDNAQVTRKARRWQDSSSRKQARRAGMGMAQGIINLLLIIWAVRDLRRRPDSEINGNKKLWMLAAFAPPFGPIAYFLFGRKRGTLPEGTPAIDESIPLHGEWP